MSKRNAKRKNDEVVIELGGPGLEAFNQCFGFPEGNNTLTTTLSTPSATVGKPITKTEIRKQAKEKDSKIKNLILNKLRRMNFPVEVKIQPKTLKLSNKEVTGGFTGEYEWYMEYEVDCKSKIPTKIGGIFVFDCLNASKGDDLLKQTTYGSVNLVHQDYVTSF